MEDFLYFCNMEKVFIAGPCVIESAELLDTVAQEFVRIRQTLGVEIIWPFSLTERMLVYSTSSACSAFQII